MNFNDLKILQDTIPGDELIRVELTNGTKIHITKEDRLTRSSFDAHTVKVIKKLSTGTQCVFINLNKVVVFCNTRKSTVLRSLNNDKPETIPIPGSIPNGDDAL